MERMSYEPARSRHHIASRRVRVTMNVILAATGLVALASLVIEYGGFADVRDRYSTALHVTQACVLAVFILDRFVRLFLARSRRRYLRANWLDFALIAALAVTGLMVFRLRGKFLSVGTLYVAITQIYILVTILLHVITVNLHFADSGVHPSWMLIGSFAIMCLVGSGLLMLPAASTPNSEPIRYHDALFTAVSATCVTGLVVRDTGRDFSAFGQGVILVLIQLGGLGIMLFGTVLAMWMGKGLTVRGSDAIGQMMGHEGIGRLSRAVKFVVLVTLGFEAIGAVLMYPMFAGMPDAFGKIMSAPRAVWHGVFHSISSFCNAGFSLYGRNMMAGVGQDGWPAPLRQSWQIMGVMAPLIVLGGLGFPVLQDLAGYAWRTVVRLARRVRRRRLPLPHGLPRPRLSLHSKLILTTSLILIALGAAVLYLVEPPPGRARAARVGRHPINVPAPADEGRPLGDWPHMNRARRARAVVFQSITARTAGFNTIDMRELSSAGKLWMCGLMIVGGSPASTAGGMKTATFALLIAATWCVLRRRNEVEIFRRSISAELLRRTVTLAVLYLLLLGTITLLLCVTMRLPGQTVDLFFEACSACGTVGLSTGITGKLTQAGKYVIITGMFVGRLGLLTLLLALTAKVRHVRYSYPNENVVIG